MRLVVPANRVNTRRPRQANCVIVSSYSNVLQPDGPPMLGTGAVLREQAAPRWQQAITSVHAGALVRGLMHSDGSRFTNPVTRRGRSYRYPRYFFANGSADIRRILCEHLDLLAIEWRPAARRKISIARRDSVARLDAFVGPKR